MVAARDSFITAVYAALDAGYTNTVIGGAADMTEGGIRMLVKRNRRPRATERLKAQAHERSDTYGMHPNCGGTWVQHRLTEDSAFSPGLICSRCHAQKDYRRSGAFATP